VYSIENKTNYETDYSYVTEFKEDGSGTQEQGSGNN
jgi:hypothetical protein